MNCKPGDLAVLVSVDDARFAQNIGSWYAVVGPGPSNLDPEWKCTALQPVVTWTTVVGRLSFARRGDVVYIRDRNLRPIRGPQAPVAVEHTNAVSA